MKYFVKICAKICLNSPVEFTTAALLVTAAVDAVVSCDRIADAISTANSDGFEAASSGGISLNGLGAVIDGASLPNAGAFGVGSCTTEIGVVSISDAISSNWPEPVRVDDVLRSDVDGRTLGVATAASEG